MKFLTIRQPWASLIAVGAKTIETRPFSTTYRGTLAIHAGKARPTITWLPGFTDVTGEPIAEGPGLTWLDMDAWRTVPLPLGAVVAVCDLIDVVPILGVNDTLTRSWQRHVAPKKSDGTLGLWSGPEGYSESLGRGTWRIEDIESQRPFGDFTPGRHAWLLDNVRPIDPIPMKGAQGLRDLPDEITVEALLGVAS